MSLRSRYGSTTSFLDLLFNTLLGFVFLFIVAFLLIVPEKKDAAINTQAEYVITLTWEDESHDDVDTWLQDPTEGVLSYIHKEVNLMHLDRDDLGNKKDMIELPDGSTIEYKHNQEITTIRGFIPGEWILNIHMYKKRDKKSVKVKIKVEKLNPYKLVYANKYDMKTQWEEITVLRFTMDGLGDVLSVDFLPKGIVTATNEGAASMSTEFPSGEDDIGGIH